MGFSPLIDVRGGALYVLNFMNQIPPRSKMQNLFLILMLGSLNALTPFSIDLYLPAFPQIALALNTTIAKVAFSVSTYFVGYAVGQLLYGPLLDRYGRKPPLYAGLILYMIASVTCTFSENVEQLMLYRVFQAFGGCVAGVAATAMVKDFYPQKEATKVFSMLMLVLSTSPLLAPTIGSFIAESWGWKAEFIALTALAAAILFFVFFFLPEGHKGDTSVSLNPKSITSEFKKIFSIPMFHVHTLAGSFAFAGLFVYIAGSPAIFMEGFQVSAQVYSAIFAFLAVGMIGGGQLNLLLVKKFSSRNILKTAVIIQMAVGALFFTGVLFQLYGLTATVAFLFILLSCAGISYPNAVSLALSPFSKNAGTASALLGFIQLGIGAVISGLIGVFDIKGTLPTALVIFFSSSVALLILYALKVPASPDPIQEISGQAAH